MDAVFEFPVTARKIGPNPNVDLSPPQVFYLKVDDVERIVANKSAVKGGCHMYFKNYAPNKRVALYESVEEVRVAMGATGTSISADPYVGQQVNLAVTGVSGGVTSTSILSTYFSRYTSGTGASANVRLPAPSDRNLVVIVNGTTAPVSVYPNGASGSIDSGASGVPKVLGAFKRLHFVTLPTTGNGASVVWKTATDKQFN